MTKFLPINEIETTTAHTWDYSVTIYFRNAAGEKHSTSLHRYRANELRNTVEEAIKTVADFGWADEATYATCAKVYCWKTEETFWFSVR